MKKRISVWGLFLLAIPLLAGCAQQTESHGEEAAAAPAVEPAVETVAQAAVEATAEMEAILAVADRVDGEEDHVVAKCPTCAFAMDGSDEHALSVGGYELHFCSGHCQESFSEDLAGSVLAMAVPEEEAPAEQQR
jgi:hypothetical protein